MTNFFKINVDTHRVYGLDIIRFYAIFSVVFEHGIDLIYQNPVTDFILLLLRDGVTIFFVLSGFLIGRILIKTLENNRLSFGTILNFWIRRWFRTLPAYFVVLAINIILFLGFRPDKRLVLKYFTFTQNLFSNHPSFFPEAWSLSVEEWFYLTLPIIIGGWMLLTKGKVQKAMVLAALFIYVAVICFKIYRYLHHDFSDIYLSNLYLKNQVSTRLDSLMFGVIGAYLYIYHSKFWVENRNILLIIGLVLLFLPGYSGVFHQNKFYEFILSPIVESLGTLCLLPYFSTLKKSTGPIYQGITYISIISYSMYLFNYSIVRNKIMPYFLGIFGSSVTSFLLFWAFTIVLSHILYKLVELPVMNLRDKVKWG